MTDSRSYFKGVVARLEALGRWRRKQKSFPKKRDSSCVIIGPISSGKSALLYSLRRCTDTSSHSYSGRFEVMPPIPIPENNDSQTYESRRTHSRNATEGVPSENNDFQTYESRLRDEFFPAGLDFAATQMNESFRPKFAITVHALDKVEGFHANKAVETTFTTFDGSGGLLLEEESRVLGSLPAVLHDDYHEACKQLNKDLKSSEAIIICLPINARVEEHEHAALGDYLNKFCQEGSDYQVRRIVVCFTKYELLGTRYHRHAFRRLASRPAAAQAMHEALTERMPGIWLQLRGFNRTPGRSVWCAPVSTYGFIPRHGGSNYDPGTKLLRTRAFDKGKSWTPDYPYSMELAFQDLWRPFLTIDPFVFIATGVAEGTLIHQLDELL